MTRNELIKIARDALTTIVDEKTLSKAQRTSDLKTLISEIYVMISKLED